MNTLEKIKELITLINELTEQKKALQEYIKKEKMAHIKFVPQYNDYEDVAILGTGSFTKKLVNNITELACQEVQNTINKIQDELAKEMNKYLADRLL